MVYIFFLLSLFSLKAEDYSWDNRVYLASFPRCGNHWMRYLIEEATGIATSSVYQDQTLPPHMDRVFPWGGYCADKGYEGNREYPKEGEIVVVKTHCPCFPPNCFDELPYTKTIRIVRHPVDTFYSFHKYLQETVNNQTSLHQCLGEFVYLLNLVEEYWEAQENVFTIRYEDLHRDPFFVLKTALSEIGYKTHDRDVIRAVKTYPPQGEILKHISHYTEDELIWLESQLDHYMKKYQYEIPLLLKEEF
ncbi:sulfotransferase domain-containing protein [Criblamydia sequanensis]|uniref:Sulfotransferase domain-containing protein n=1 Tax=Candidatus Criblamydia sequanensis CRIB-18 TaxID=1437425 RepID=A0A090D359_9BACT|nr:sulfotransferase domain-containing protein [Criblamydia sequanensis]CDR35210.1 hypothetical protein CSEC_2404 [Criblamydia sequanensis CRIB-18]